jgi:hypothetical protein
MTISANNLTELPQQIEKTAGSFSSLQRSNPSQKIVTQKPQQQSLELHASNLSQLNTFIHQSPKIIHRMNRSAEQNSLASCNYSNKCTNGCCQAILECIRLCNCCGLSAGVCGPTSCYVIGILCEMCLTTLR